MTSNNVEIENESVGNPRVSLTGYATASAWAYFGFPEAGRFDTHRGRLLFGALHAGCRLVRPISPAAGALTQALYWRHRWFSCWVVAQNADLVVEIGAGLSSRGLVHAEHHPDSHWVDYDLPGMVTARRHRLADRALPENYHLETGDVLAPGLGQDIVAPSTPDATVVLLEGVIDYLDRGEKRRALSAISQMLGRLGGGRLLLDIHPARNIERFGLAAPMLLGALKRISGRDLTRQLFSDTDDGSKP